MVQKARNVSAQSNEARNLYVVEHITSALLELMRKKQLKDISITELCDSAGVGRMSFYRNFESKEAVLQRYDQTLVEKWIDKYQAEGDEDNVPKLLYHLMLHYKEHEQFYTLLYKNDCSLILLDTIKKINKLSPDVSNAEAYAKSFVAYSVFGIVNEWIGRGMLESAEELAALFGQV